VDAGALLGGKYRLRERLGVGGMGEVWAAADEGLGRGVAVKILRADLSSDPILVHRLRKEARVAAMLRHPGITVVHDIGEHDGHPYFVMELLEGRDFTQVMSGHPDGLPVGQAAALMLQVADALAHAHDHGVVHRDIKPANLMELSDGTVKICDFGIARYADAEATAQLTEHGSVLGTLPFMAPELYEGQPADSRTDLYAFGCTLYALLAGRPPFSASSPAAIMGQHRAGPPPRLSTLRPDIPTYLDDLVQRLLATNPEQRPVCSDAQRVLRSVLGPQHGQTHPATLMNIENTPQIEPPHGRSKIVRRGLIGVGALAVIAAIATVVLLPHRTSATSKHNRSVTASVSPSTERVPGHGGRIDLPASVASKLKESASADAASHGGRAICYTGQYQNIGWDAAIACGHMNQPVGHANGSTHIEALAIVEVGAPRMCLQAHVATIGWQPSTCVASGQIGVNGTVGRDLPMEAVKLWIDGWDFTAIGTGSKGPLSTSSANGSTGNYLMIGTTGQNLLLWTLKITGPF
jgi:serine/threonine protein kinase